MILLPFTWGTKEGNYLIPGLGHHPREHLLKKICFCAYDRKNTNYDHHGCDDNHDGNLDDKDDIK